MKVIPEGIEPPTYALGTRPLLPAEVASESRTQQISADGVSVAHNKPTTPTTVTTAPGDASADAIDGVVADQPATAIRNICAGARSFVYFFGVASLIKIGISKEPSERMARIVQASGLPLQLLTKAPGGRAIEKGLHLRFAPWRIGREWFRSTQELMLLVEEVSLAESPEDAAEILRLVSLKRPTDEEWAPVRAERTRRILEERHPTKGALVTPQQIAAAYSLPIDEVYGRLVMATESIRNEGVTYFYGRDVEWLFSMFDSFRKRPPAEPEQVGSGSEARS